ALRLDLLPGCVEALGPDEAEDVTLATVLPHERRREAQATTRLQLGGQLEDGGGQQVHLVVDDEAPVERVEQFEMGVLPLPLRGEDLVGRDRDRLDLLALARVLADLVL